MPTKTSDIIVNKYFPIKFIVAKIVNYEIINYICVELKRAIVIFVILQALSHSGKAQVYSTAERATIYMSEAMAENDTREKAALFHMAAEYFWNAIADSKGTVSPEVAEMYYNYAFCQLSSGGEKKSVVNFSNEYLNYIYRIFGEASCEYCYALSKCASLCILAGDLCQARELLRKAKTIPVNKTDKKYWDSQFSIMRSEVDLNARVKKYRESARIGKRYIRLSKRYGTKEDIFEAYSLLSLKATDLKSVMAFDAGRIRRKYLNLLRPQVDSNLYLLPEAARIRFMKSTKNNLDHLISFDGNAEISFDAVLLSKALLSGSALTFKERVDEASKLDPSIADLYYKMNSYAANGASPMVINSLDRLIIARLNDLLPYNKSNNEIPTWKKIREKIKEDDIVIEFFKIDSDNYGLLYGKKDWTHPRVIDISINDDYWLSSFKPPWYSKLDIHRDSLLFTEDHCSSIWPWKVLRHFPKTQEGVVYFSPVGDLSLFGIEYLPMYSSIDRGHPLSDIFNMVRLSSTANILSQNNSRSLHAGLYGGPDYYAGKASETIKDTSNRQIDIDYENSALNTKSYRQIPLIPSTIEEVHAIDSILNGSDLFTGRYATEKNLTDNIVNESIVHIATHGFFIPAEEASGHAYYARVFEKQPELIGDPFYRSGVYMAGSAAYWLYGIVPDDSSSDGILTAKEISLMDLRNSDLVVLSACRTGYGEESFNGIEGLQTAFKRAGAGSILMSVRDVDDEATKILMENFYKFYIGTGNMTPMSKTAALAAAQSVLRHSSKWNDPKYWAAFILLDP